MKPDVDRAYNTWCRRIGLRTLILGVGLVHLVVTGHRLLAVAWAAGMAAIGGASLSLFIDSLRSDSAHAWDELLVLAVSSALTAAAVAGACLYL